MLMFLALIDEGRQDDFIKIYTRYKSLATKTAGYYLSNRYDVEEIVQTAFFRISQCLDRLDTDNPRRVANFVITVTRNCCYDLLRKQRRSPKTVTIDSVELLPDEEDAYERLIDRETYAEVVKYILKMPEKYRFVLYLYYACDLSITAIAVALNISRSTAHGRLTKGIEMIKRRIGGVDNG